MNTRDTFRAIRRAYRASLRVSPMLPGALEARIAASDALRAIMHRWDLCDPAPMLWQQSINKRAPSGAVVYCFTVYASCTRFLRAHRGQHVA